MLSHLLRIAFVGMMFLTLLAFGLLLTLPALAEGGTGPGDALLPIGAEATAPPGSQTWYRFYESGSGYPVTAALYAYGQSGIGFKVYSPRALAAWTSGDPLKPIGASSSSPEYDQVWAGRLNEPGTYYIVVENTASVPIGYRLRVTGDGVTTTVQVIPTATPLPNPFKKVTSVGKLSGGGKLVFQESSGGNIYIVNADGTELKRVTFGLDPAFSPDGTRIAFARQGPIPGLYVANADGSNERLLYGAPEVRSPSWNKDGNQLVFSTVASITAQPPVCFFGRCFELGDKVLWKLKRYDLRDDTVHDLRFPKSGGTVPNWASNDNIVFMNPEMGLMLTTSADDAEAKLLDYDLTINTPAFSPDAQRLTYMIQQPPTWQVVVAVWDGTNPTLLTRQDPLDFVHPNNVAPTFSPNNDEVLFLSNRNGKWEFFAIGIDGTNERQVLKEVTDAVNLQYTYNGERVASWVKSSNALSYPSGPSAASTTLRIRSPYSFLAYLK